MNLEGEEIIWSGSVPTMDGGVGEQVQPVPDGGEGAAMHAEAAEGQGGARKKVRTR